MPVGTVTPGSLVTVTPDSTPSLYTSLQAPSSTMGVSAAHLQALTLAALNIQKTATARDTLTGSDLLYYVNSAVNYLSMQSSSSACRVHVRETCPQNAILVISNDTAHDVAVRHGGDSFLMNLPPHCVGFFRCDVSLDELVWLGDCARNGSRCVPYFRTIASQPSNNVWDYTPVSTESTILFGSGLSAGVILTIAYGPTGVGHAGDKVRVMNQSSYTITVKNTGNVTMASVTTLTNQIFIMNDSGTWELTSA
jgi:hypothetical protein